MATPTWGFYNCRRCKTLERIANNLTAGLYKHQKAVGEPACAHKALALRVGFMSCSAA